MALSTRDLRLDFFRGLSLLLIFVDHIPGNVFSYFTLANFVFNDAADIFVFISGYTAAIVFGGIAARSGASYATIEVLRRCWTLYVAHIFLFVLFTAQVAYTAEQFANPMFIDEMRVAGFLEEPHVAIVKALALQFQPEFLNILPLYILLLLAFAITLPIPYLHGWHVLVPSVLLYIAAQIFRINLPTYPGGHWYFNPLAWQLLFFIGVVCSGQARTGGLAFIANRNLFAASLVILALSLLAKLVLLIDEFFDIVPPDVITTIWPFIDKTYLGPLRLLNFLALAIVVVRLVPRGSRLVETALARPVIRCGQHSLYIFCLGILLSYLAHLILVEISHALLLQFAVSAGGILIMMAVAAFFTWTKSQSRALESPRDRASRESIARQGGE